MSGGFIYVLIFLSLVIAALITLLSITIMKQKKTEKELKRVLQERLQAEEMMKQREERYRNLVEFSPDAIIVQKDEDIVFFNETWLSLIGADSEEIMAERSLWDFVHPEDVEATKRCIHTVENEKKIQFFDTRLVRCSGQTAAAEIKALPVLFQDEPVVHMIIRDVSEKKRLEEIYQNSEKLSVLGQLAAGIAHEIRNPLTTIGGFVQLMKPKVKNHDLYFDMILSELERINFIVSEFLMLSKPQVVQYNEKNLITILEDVITLLKTQAVMNQIEIIFRCEIRHLTIDCIENHLKQVFINVMKNAVDAMPGGGKLDISVKLSNEDQVLLRFQDEGPGISEELLPLLGQPFYTTKDKGTGLGLMVSYKIIEDHQGRIHIESEQERGTTVSIALPIRQDASERMD
jgi:two-component system sporulation sensor kinase A